MVAHAFNRMLRSLRQVDFYEYEASLGYTGSYRLASQGYTARLLSQKPNEIKQNSVLGTIMLDRML